LTRLLLFVVASISLASLACGFTNPPPTPTPSPTEVPIPADAVIEQLVIAGFAQESREIKVGTFVKWKNDQDTLHTVTHTPTEGGVPIAFGISLQRQDTFIYEFTEPGTFRYVCLIHPVQMIGTITVTE
jgi:plastocyanin